MIWYDMIWYDMIWYGMVWYGMVWYGMVWYGMASGVENIDKIHNFHVLAALNPGKLILVTIR